MSVIIASPSNNSSKSNTSVPYLLPNNSSSSSLNASAAPVGAISFNSSSNVTVYPIPVAAPPAPQRQAIAPPFSPQPAEGPIFYPNGTYEDTGSSARAGSSFTTVELTSLIAVGAICGLLLLICVRCELKKKKHGRDHEDSHVDVEFDKDIGLRRFIYQELARATENFKAENKLGQGGFGIVYKGFLRDLNSYVAVKRISKESKQGIKEFQTEVKIINRLRHRNLVKLIGWCLEKKEFLLVYEFLPNGSLDYHLFKKNNLLSWEVRYNIVLGLASGLSYLHDECEECVLHRDIKSSNVMLDSNFNAKLGDFGLARLMDHAKGSQTTALAGTMGYLAPECVVTGRASRESDVYSFGVLVLEIACGRKPVEYDPNDGYHVHIVHWIWGLYGQGKLLEAVDPRLDRDFVQIEIERLMLVGLWCAHPDKRSRPSIKQVMQVLKFEAPMPALPSNMPEPIYYGGPINLSSFSSSSREIQTASL